MYLRLPSPQAALDRVARRVQEGGHGIPDDVVVRRYWAGLANLQRLYLPLADVAVIYDNSDGQRTLIAEQLPGGSLIVHDANRWAMIERARTVTEKTPREILDAIDKALEETAARLAAKPKPALRRPPSDQPPVRTRPKTPREILDAVDKALDETARRFVDRAH